MMNNLKLKQVLPDGSTETLQDVKETPGLHLIGDLYDCACKDAYLLDVNLLTEHCLQLVKDAGLTAVGHYFHQFTNEDGSAGGVTGMVVLAESHLSVHTWPERRYVTVDVYVCNYTSDNRPKARKLFNGLLRTFGSTNAVVHTVDRP